MPKVSKSDFSNIIDNIVQLKTEFVRSSGGQPFYHKQIYHQNGWYIYIVNNNFYEVFREKIIDANTYEDGKYKKLDLKKVKYPSDEDFGFWAWCVDSYDTALSYTLLKI